MDDPIEQLLEALVLHRDNHPDDGKRTVRIWIDETVEGGDQMYHRFSEQQLAKLAEYILSGQPQAATVGASTPATVIAAIELELRLAASNDGYESAAVAEELYRTVAKQILASIEATPKADYVGAWTELTGYVEEACGDSGTIVPADMRAYMRELKRKALAPIRDWMNAITAKKEGD